MEIDPSLQLAVPVGILSQALWDRYHERHYEMGTMREALWDRYHERDNLR